MKSKDVIMNMLETLKAMHRMSVSDIDIPAKDNTESEEELPTFSCLCGKCKTKGQYLDPTCQECGFPVMVIDPKIGYAIDVDFTIVNDNILEGLGDENE